ncbi:MAG: hypothetical protein KJ905_00315 [Nanoarchaeota archaeon]|nr:hypothetical protein [Nanoarchaeota archaeon]MBU1501204.1 hypothetical protein [Nanoarchaeota archaeon]
MVKKRLFLVLLSLVLISSVLALTLNININYPTSQGYSSEIENFDWTYSAPDFPIDSCWFVLNEDSPVNVDCNSNSSSLTPFYGQNNLTLYVNNSQGDLNNSFLTFYVDNVSPIINSIDYPLNQNYGEEVSSINFLYSEDYPNQCWYSTDNGVTNSTQENCTNPMTFSGVNFNQGNNTWIVYVQDQAGNLNSSSIEFWADSIYPNISIIGVADEIYYLSQRYVDLSFNVTETNPKNSGAFKFEVVGIGEQTTTYRDAESDGVYNFRHPSSGEENSDGIVYYKITFEDTMGHISTLNQTITMDTLNPAFQNLTNTSIYFNEIFTYQVNATDSSGIYNFTIDNSNFEINSSGYLTNISTLSMGTNFLTITAIDNAFNSVSENVSLTVLNQTQQYASTLEVVVENTTEEIVFNKASTTEIISVPFTISSTQKITLNLDSLLSSGNVSIPNKLNLQRTITGNVSYTAEIPVNTTIIGGAGWDGKINLPVLNLSTFTYSSAGSIDVVIDLGSGVELNFSQPVKVILGGMAGKKAAWSQGGLSLTNIPQICNSKTNPTNIDSINSRECYIDDGSDLIIWTLHFTSFAAYTPSVPVSLPGQSLGGGGGSSCTTTWECTEWSRCLNGIETRTCTKLKDYCSAFQKPLESTTCAVETPESFTNESGEENTEQLDSEGYFSIITGAVIGIGTSRYALGVIFIISLGRIYLGIRLKRKKTPRIKRNNLTTQTSSQTLSS